MADDILGLGKATTEALSLLKDPVKALCGPAYEELAGAIGDRVRHWRDMRRLDLALDTVKQLKSKGINPKAVDPQLLHPILDAGSLVDDRNLRGKWVNLLAQASVGDARKILPAFSSILSELSPFEARLLDDLTEETPPEAEESSNWGMLPVEVADAMTRITDISSPFSASVYEANFIRLGLIVKDQSPVDEKDILNVVDHANSHVRTERTNYLGQDENVPSVRFKRWDYLFFTELGIAFVYACREV